MGNCHVDRPKGLWSNVQPRTLSSPVLLYELIRNAFGSFVNVLVVARKMRLNERPGSADRVAAARLAPRAAQGYARRPESNSSKTRVESWVRLSSESR